MAMSLESMVLNKIVQDKTMIWNNKNKTHFFKPIHNHPLLLSHLALKVNHLIGRVYDFDFNRFRIKNLSIVAKGMNETTIKIDSFDGLHYFPIRTDGLYRITQPRGIYSRALRQFGIRGHWVSPHILHLDWLIIGESYKYEVTLFFLGKELIISVRDNTKQWNHIWVRGRLKKL